MKALCWHGTNDVRIDTVPDPKIEDRRDIIVKITASGICGSDLHLLNGFMPTMDKGDIPGHESMGVVVETGAGVSNLKKGDRVVVPVTISCGELRHRAGRHRRRVGMRTGRAVRDPKRVDAESRARDRHR